MAKAKTDTKAKTKKTQPAAAESFGPRVDVFDAQGKPRTVDASALRIAFADGRSLILDHFTTGPWTSEPERNKALGWLRGRTNDFVNALRPRIKVILADLEREN